MIAFTVWKTVSSDGRVHHNHVEEGFSTDDAPIPQSDMQKCWVGKKWRKEYRFMIRDDGGPWRTVPMGNE